jgi:C4-dicarboxylate transporter DctQ subunit
MKSQKMEMIARIHRTLATVLGGLVLILMFVIIVDVVGRFGLNKPLPGGVEVSMLLFVWVIFLPLAYVLFEGNHVRLTLLLSRLPQQGRSIAEVINAILSLLLFGLLMYAGWSQFWESFLLGETMAAPIWIPLWVGKLAVPLGCLLMVTQLCIDLVTHGGRPGGKE